MRRMGRNGYSNGDGLRAATHLVQAANSDLEHYCKENAPIDRPG